MKKRTKILLVLVGILAVGGIALAMRRGTPVQAVTDTAKRGDLEQTVEVTGDVRAADDIDLAFSTSGVVDFVGVRVGDKVVAGQMLASLRASELRAAAAQADELVAEARANLDLKMAGASEEEIAVAKADVSVAEAALASARSDAEQATSVQEIAVTNAEDDLTTTKTDTTRDFDQAVDDLLESARSVTVEARHALAEADTVLGVENGLFNQTFDDVLANEDAQTLLDATSAFETAALSRDKAEDALLSVDSSDADSVRAASECAWTAYEDAYETLLQTARVLDATSADSVELSLDDLVGYKTTIATAQASLTADGTSLANARQATTNAEQARTDDVRSAENALATAQAEQARVLAASDATVASREADLARAQSGYDELVAVPREVDLSALRAAVRSAQASAEAARARLEDTEIVAPISGLVTAVDVDPGESAVAGSPLMTVLSGDGQFEIRMDIPEADVADIRAGQTADVTFDAFGDDSVFHGSVYKVDPAQKVIEGVVFYEATVLLDSNQDQSQIKPGMTATVTIHTASRTGVVYVPSRSVLEENGVKYVRIPSGDGNAFERRTVTVGLRADGGLVEILDGLSEGETVIVSIPQKTF